MQLGQPLDLEPVTVKPERDRQLAGQEFGGLVVGGGAEVAGAGAGPGGGGREVEGGAGAAVVGGAVEPGSATSAQSWAANAEEE